MYFVLGSAANYKKYCLLVVLMDCVFCKIVSGSIKAKTVLETERSLAFLDAFPLCVGHTLVIPKRHYEKIQDMGADDNSDLFSLVHRVLSKVDSLDGATLLAVHNGKNAGQEVPHVHVHLIPRRSDDGAGPVHSMFSKRPHLTESQFSEVLDRLR